MIDRDYQIESLKNRYKGNTSPLPIILTVAGIFGMAITDGVIGYISLILVIVGLVIFIKQLSRRQAVEGEIRADPTITAAEAAYIKT